MGNHGLTAPRRLITVFVAAGLLAAAAVTTPAAAAATTGSAAAAAARSGPTDRAFTRTIEPFYPASPPASPPGVLPRVACVRPAGPGRIEAVFGYDNVGTLSQDAPIGDGTPFSAYNQILHRVGDVTTVQDQGPQVTQFRPGGHPYAFSLTFPIGEVPSWKVAVHPADPADEFNLWWVTVTPTFRKACGPRVPKHFSVVQLARVGVSPTSVTYDPAGNAIGYDVTADMRDVATVCSDGGTVEPYRFIVGWNVADSNLVPQSRRQVIRTATYWAGTPNESHWQYTRTNERKVVDPSQQTYVIGPSVDLTGACSFPDGSSARSITYWVDPPMATDIRIVDVDGIATIQVGSVLPGGVRTR